MRKHKFWINKSYRGDVIGSRVTTYEIDLENSLIDCEDGSQYDYMRIVSDFRRVELNWQTRARLIATVSNQSPIPIEQHWRETLASAVGDAKLHEYISNQISRGIVWEPASDEVIECIEKAVAKENAVKPPN